MRASVHALALPVLAVLIASGCAPLRDGLENATEHTVTLQPTRTGALMHTVSGTFGVCVGLDGRGGRPAAWDHFLTVEDENPAVDGMAGYQVSVSRGESCHQRVLSQFQTLAAFDISALPPGALTRAVLRATPLLDRQTDAPVPPGTPGQCNILRVGRATSAWPPGESIGPLVTWAPIPPPPAAFGRYARFGPVDVTRAVRAWRDGGAANTGFVITPQHDIAERNAEGIEQENDSFLCDLLLGRFELDVTMLIPG